jgi:hypothetical protein
MADSTREKISKNIVTTLQGVVGIMAVERFSQSGMSSLSVPYILLDEGFEDVLSDTQPITRKRIEYRAVFIHRHDQVADIRSTAEVLNEFRAKIETALQNDIARGGFALDTTAPSFNALEIESGQPEVGFVASWFVDFQYARLLP